MELVNHLCRVLDLHVATINISIANVIQLPNLKYRGHVVTTLVIIELKLFDLRFCLKLGWSRKLRLFLDGRIFKSGAGNLTVRRDKEAAMTSCITSHGVM